MNQSLIISLFFAGLFGSPGHCTGMCGPLVLSQIGALGEKSKGCARLLLPYHLGRVSTYVAMAVIFNLFVGMSGAISPLKEVLTVFLLSLAALMFFVTAIPKLLAMFPWAARVGIPVSSRFMVKITAPFMVNPTGLRGYALGLMLGFMPCGMVMAALMAAATAPSPSYAAVAMLAFGAGTIPVLAAIGGSGLWVKKKWPVPVGMFSGFVMLVNSFILVWLAAQVSVF